MAKKNVCRQTMGYGITHKDAAAQHARIRAAAKQTADDEAAKKAISDERINALLRADTEHLRPARRTP